MFISSHFRKKKVLLITLNGSPSFDPVSADSGGGFYRWDLGDGTLLPDSSSFSHAYADTAVYTVFAYKRYIKTITTLIANSDSLLSIDASELTGLSTTFEASNNPNLTSVILPIQDASAVNITSFEIFDCDLTGTFDMSGITKLESIVDLHGNNNMTILIATGVLTGGGSVTSAQLYGNASLQTIDISGWVTIRSLLQFRNSPALTSISLPNTNGISTGAFTTFNGYQCPNLTTIDASNLENLGGAIQVYQNTVMTSMLFPATPTAKITQLRIESCNLSTLDLSSQTLDGQIRFQQNSNLTSFLAPVVTGGDTVNIFWGYDCNLTGTLNLTAIEIIRSSFIVRNNPLLTGITFFATPHAQVLNTFQAFGCGLTGTLDVSMFQALAGDFDVKDNPSLTGITNPTSAGVFTDYNASNCDLTGLVDFSGLTGLGAIFDIRNNPNLTGITAPVSAQEFDVFFIFDCGLTGILNLTGLTGGFTNFQAHTNSALTGITFDAGIAMTANGNGFRVHDCDLTGTLDVSALDKLGGVFFVYGNANLTGITFPTSTVLVDDVDVKDCDLTGTLDLSPLNLGDSIEGGNNSNLTGITNPTNSNTFSLYSFQNCGISFVDMTTLSGLFDSPGCSTSFNANSFSVAQVNEMLVDFDTNSAGAIGGRSLNLAGAGMGIPDAVSGGFDGVAAKASLIVKGYTVTTN